MTDIIPKILIVEDEPTLREVYTMVLGMQGFRTATASNGIEALAQIKKSVPHLVLLDVLMPGMDGREFLRNLDTDAYPDMKIIVSSNIADLDVVEEMLALGAHQHVLKSSITPNSLVETVQNALEIQSV